MKNKKGFTILELVIVIIILCILGALAFPRFLDLKREANKSATSKSTTQAIKTSRV